MTPAEADLRALGWEPDHDTLQRFREMLAADQQRDDPLTATDHARFAVKRAKERYRRQRKALR
jgi:hypothetical protein